MSEGEPRLVAIEGSDERGRNKLKIGSKLIPGTACGLP
jgi:hypothetical protein